MAVDPIRVLIADDSADFRRGLRALLALAEEVAVLGEAASGEEAIVRATTSQPDVVLMDLGMPGINGIEATRSIVATSPHIAVLMLSMFEDDESVLAAMRAGARGYLLKGAPRKEVVRALQVVTNGGIILGPSIARRALELFAPHPSSSALAQPAAVPFPQLTGREREILSLVADGLDNTKIAARLTLSQKTVRNHIHAVYGKLQVQTRPAAIVQARDAGLGTPRDIRNAAQRQPD